MISIQTNYASLVAQNNLSTNNNFQTKTIQSLTSGYRINSSGDDAAGLAVANEYRSSVSELTQGVRNANDGVSTLQIIDGGLNNIAQMLDRLKTLATESASTTFTGDRSVLNNEYQSLLGEIDRQAANIGLGGSNMVNVTNVLVYIGGGQGASQNSQVNVDLSAGKVDSGALGLSGTSVNGASPVTVGSGAAAVIAAGAVETFKVSTSAGTTTITLVGKTGDSVQDQINELNSQLGSLGISASLVSNKLSFSSSQEFSVSVAGAGLASNADAAVNTTLNNQQLTYNPAAAGAFDITVGSKNASLLLATGLSDDQAAASLNAQLTAAGITDVTAVSDPAGTHKLTLQSADTFSLANITNFTANGAYTPAAGSGNGALNAIDMINAAVRQLGMVQGKVGTGENELNYAINLANSQITNFSAAESRIRDADVATEAANLTKAQVLQQASIAAMAQANAAPQAVLALLKG